MTNKSRSKGTRWESRLVGYLIEHGFPLAERRVQEGKNDRGDVSGVVGWILEAKNHAALNLSGWMDEARKEAANAGVDNYAVVFPRKSHSAAEAYCLLPLKVFVRLLKENGDPK